jgi:hypothetical protein
MTARTSLSTRRRPGFDLAVETYRAACLRWPGAAITIRQGAQILEDSRKRRLALSPKARRRGGRMTTLTIRYIKSDFVVTGPDIEPARFKTRLEAKDWCVAHYPGSPIKEIGSIYKPPPARSDEQVTTVNYTRCRGA